MISILGRRAAVQSATMVSRRPPLALRLPQQPTGMTGSSTLISGRRALFLAPTAVVRAANPQTGKPASDNLKHMVQNAKEEAGGIRSSIESAVAGTTMSQAKQDSKDGADASPNEILTDAKSIIGEMAQRVPRPALIWGASGIIPYVSTAGASIYLARQAQLVAQGLDSHIDYETASALLLHAENVQITFGAILLSFLGAIHWGFEFAKYGGEIGHRRYMLGLLPIAFAWPTLLMSPQMGLVAQWGGFVATWFIDLRATTMGWAPKWYSSYRFGLTLAVGLSILATLAGTNYYEANESRSSRFLPGRGLSEDKKRMAERNQQTAQRVEQGKRGTPVVKGQTTGDVEAEDTGEEGDSYVKVRNPKRIEEERKEKEEEEKKKKEEEQKKKDEEQKKGKEEKKDNKDKEDK